MKAQEKQNNNDSVLFFSVLQNTKQKLNNLNTQL